MNLKGYLKRSFIKRQVLIPTDNISSAKVLAAIPIEAQLLSAAS
jgi:hypothetical protein